MASNEIHVGDTPLIRVTFYDENAALVDLTGYTCVLLMKKSDDVGTLLTKTLTAASPTTGVGTYQVLSTDFDVAGDWQFEGYISKVGPPIVSFHSDITVRKVYANLS